MALEVGDLDVEERVSINFQGKEIHVAVVSHSGPVTMVRELGQPGAQRGGTNEHGEDFVEMVQTGHRVFFGQTFGIPASTRVIQRNP